jgi:hypothetical protein
MGRRIVLAGLASVVVLAAWALVGNALLGVRSRVDMRRPQDMEQVYQVLRANIPSPGGYVVHSAANDTGPTDDPVFGVRYSGLAHSDAGRTMAQGLVRWLLASIIVAGLLSVTAARVFESYAGRVLFVVTVGLLIAVTGDLSQYDIGRYPLGSAALLALDTVAAWTLVGLVMARIVRPVG